MEFIINFLESWSTADLVTLLTIATTFLSHFLAYIEYFRLKAIWDFYYLDDQGRHNVRSGFHPEYLATSLLIIGGIIIVSSTQIVQIVTSRICYMILAGLVIWLCTFVGTFVIFFLFNRSEYYKGVYKKEEYYSATAIRTFLTASKYTVHGVLMIIAAKLFLSKASLAAICMVTLCSGVLWVYLEYNISKIKTAHFTKTVNIVVIDGCTYCILSIINGSHYYAVRADIDQDDTLKLFLETKIVLSSENLLVRRRNIQRICRMINNYEIPTGLLYVK